MRRLRRRDDDGAAAVEFALVGCFILIPLLFGIMQYGFFFFQSTAAEHAAREGARLAAVGITSCSDWRDAVVDRGVGANVQSASVTGSATRGADITVTLTWRPAIRLPLVGALPSGDIGETATTRLERVGAVTGGC